MVALSLLISQGLFLTPADAVPAFLFATAGGIVQVGFSLAIWAWERPRPGSRSGTGVGEWRTCART